MRTIFIALLIIASCYAKDTKATPVKILMCVPNGFHPMEYFKPREYFDKQKCEVQVASKFDAPLTPDHRFIDKYPKVIPQLTMDQVDIKNYDVIVFVGGNGAWEDFFPNKDAHKIVVDTIKSKKKLALICSAVGLLGFTKNLDGKGQPVAEGRQVTGYKKVAGILNIFGKVRYTSGDPSKPHVVVDGNLITARDQYSADLFAKTIMSNLKKN